MGSSPIGVADIIERDEMKLVTHVAYATVIAGLIALGPSFANTSNEGDLGADPSVILSEDLYCFDVVHEDRSVEKTEGSNRDRFFSIDRSLSGSSTMEDPTPEKNWDSRVSQCDSLSEWGDFERCMWFPWEYGF